MTDAPAGFREGARAVLAVVPANVALGTVVGVAWVDLGAPPAHAFAMSAFMFAGAAQLAILRLANDGAPLSISVLAGVVVNARYAMYSASIAPYFRDRSRRTRALLAYFLVDINYALSHEAFRRDAETRRVRYYLGTSVPVWASWAGGLAAGAFAGGRLFAGLDMGFVFVVLFVGLLVPALDDRPSLVAGVVGGAVAVAANGVPANGGLVIGSVCGVAAGYLADGVVGDE